jgi:hypothetical protein
MPTTYTLISSNVLSTAAASVTFSSIPATYTDLVLRMSLRGSDGGGNQIYFDLINGTTTSIYSSMKFVGSTGSNTASRQTGVTFAADPLTGGSTYAANIFSSHEIYIPNYRISQSKPSFSFNVAEDNSTAPQMSINAGLWIDNAAITSFRIRNVYANLVSGSSFYLYGVKSS